MSLWPERFFCINSVIISFRKMESHSRPPSLECVWWQECPQASNNSVLSTLGVQRTALPGDYGWPLWHRGVRRCCEVLSVPQRQSRDLPCSVEPEERAPSQPPARSALSNVALFRVSNCIVICVVKTWGMTMIRSLMLSFNPSSWHFLCFCLSLLSFIFLQGTRGQTLIGQITWNSVRLRQLPSTASQL